MRKEILSTLAQVASVLKERLPSTVFDDLLLTGGTAAAFYGSERSFSNDIDFMVTEKAVPVLEKSLGIRFERREDKPIFHSLAAEADLIEGISVDFAIPSVQPTEKGPVFSFHVTNEIRKRAKKVSAGSFNIPCVPPELLVLIKLLAGRGSDLKKYDLFDVSSMMGATSDFDFDLFGNLIGEFLKPAEKSVPLLLDHLKKAQKERPTSRLGELSEFLLSYE